jgi:hypothetical protein
MQILHRQTSRVKFNGHRIVSSKLANGEQIFENRGSYKNVVEVKGPGNG